MVALECFGALALPLLLAVDAARHEWRASGGREADKQKVNEGKWTQEDGRELLQPYMFTYAAAAWHLKIAEKQ